MWLVNKIKHWREQRLVRSVELALLGIDKRQARQLTKAYGDQVISDMVYALLYAVDEKQGEK